MIEIGQNIGHFWIGNREKFGCKIDQIKSLSMTPILRIESRVEFLNFLNKNVIGILRIKIYV